MNGIEFASLIVALLGAIVVLFLIFVAPLWIIFHYLSKNKAANSLNAGQERMLEDLWRVARRMEGRVETLEALLDVKDPQWRATPHGSVPQRETH
ncbi:MAG: envelope stress response membrane protein PspB [Maricaulaceae bacterium]